MDLLTLIETCSLAKDVGLVLAMTLSFSGGNANTVKGTKDNDSVATEAEDAPATREAALAEIRRLTDRGAAPVAGLIPTPPAWARNFERPIEDILEPCAGLGIATAMISQFEYECEHENQKRKGLECVLHKYATAIALDFFEDDVSDFMSGEEVPAMGAAVSLDSDALSEALVLVPTQDGRNWGADRLLFASAPPAQPMAAKESKPAAAAAIKSGGRARGAERLKVAPVPPLPVVPTSPATLQIQRH
jgi:hypothetical protein